MRSRVVLLALVPLGVLAACGGSGSGSTATSTASAPSTTAVTATTTPVASTEAPTTEATTTTIAPTTTVGFSLANLPGKIAITGPGCGSTAPSLSAEDIASLGTIQSVEEAQQVIGGSFNTTSQVCVMNPDGSDYLLVSDPDAETEYVGWSYDGGKLLFGVEGGWAIVNADGSDRHVRKPLEIPTPYQSPDGTSYLYTRPYAPGLYIAPIDQKKGRLLTNTPAFCCLLARWSPDSRTVLFTGYEDAARKCMQVWTMDLASGEIVKISGTGTPGEARKLCVYPDSAEWSPDGANIMFVEDGTISGKYRLHLMSPDGTNSRALLPEDAFNGAPWDSGNFAWSPDGEAVAYEVVTDDGTGGLFVSPIDGSAVLRVPVPANVLVITAIAWAPGL